MRYFYIICLALSSFFIFKQLNAAEQQKYAFFVPRNTFLQNTDVGDIDENKMRPRKSYNQDVEKIEPSITLPYVKKKIKSARFLEEEQEEDTLYEKPKIKELEPVHVSRQIIDGPDAGISSLLPEESDSSQYSLSDELSESEIKNDEKEEKELKVLSPLEEFAQLSVTEMLKKIPFPDARLPKYKQLYAEYGMDLRVLYRTGKFPYNRELDSTLEKANTIQRFKVE